MPKLRRLNGKQVIAILEQFGFSVIRIKGSHHIMNRVVDDKPQRLNVPMHGSKPIPTGTLNRIYKDALQYIPQEELRPHFYGD